jgi:peptidyl-prolyl cis-trans isomerase D
MFDNLAKRIQSVLLVLLIVILSLVMGVIGFSGPSMDSCKSNQGASYAVRVHGYTVTEGEFRAVYALCGFSRFSPDDARERHLKEIVLRGLVERELLVHEGERLGIHAESADVLRRSMREQLLLLPRAVDAPSFVPPHEMRQDFTDRTGQFSTENMRRFIQNFLHRSMDEFAAWQVRETVADRVRDTVIAPVTVSPNEIWDAYVAGTDRAQIAYIRFDPSQYRDEITVDPAALDTWMQAHAADLDRELQTRRRQYTDLPRQARAREILIRADEHAPEEERAAARARAEALLGRAQHGEDFATLARENSDDESNARRGGDLGFRLQGGESAAGRAVNDAIFAGHEGEVIDHVVESRIGFHVIKVERFREGNVPEAEAKREIADDLYRTERCSQLAQADANRALAFLRDHHTMDDLDEQLRRGWDTPVAPPVEGQEPPPPAHPNAPQHVESPPFSRADRAVTGEIDSGPVTRAAFEMTMDQPLPAEPMRLESHSGAQTWLVYQLISRTEASQAGFTDEVRQRLQAALLNTKRQDVLTNYVSRLVTQAEADGAIRRNEDILRYNLPETEGESEEGSEGGEGNEGPPPADEN